MSLLADHALSDLLRDGAVAVSEAGLLDDERLRALAPVAYATALEVLIAQRPGLSRAPRAPIRKRRSAKERCLP